MTENKKIFLVLAKHKNIDNFALFYEDFKEIELTSEELEQIKERIDSIFNETKHKVKDYKLAEILLKKLEQLSLETEKPNKVSMHRKSEISSEKDCMKESFGHLMPYEDDKK